MTGLRAKGKGVTLRRGLRGSVGGGDEKLEHTLVRVWAPRCKKDMEGAGGVRSWGKAWSTNGMRGWKGSARRKGDSGDVFFSPQLLSGG